MKRAFMVVATAAIAATVATTACTNMPRSRDLGNPNIAAMTIAQQVCSDCHGVTGNSVSPNFPNLAAQTSPYLIAQLRGFKSHNRADPAGFEYMWGLSRSLSDEQIAGLAAYYAAQSPAANKGRNDATRVSAGKQIFETGVAAKNVPACGSCHGALAQGNATFPRLAGQHADYVVKQLIVFQRTDNRPEGAVMKVIAHDLAPDEIENLAAYLQSL
ncbi:MAG: c-type cytochrome [Casimicrobium sp.]